MIFKLFIGGKQVTTDKVEYFELVRDSVISSEIGSVNREYSTNITIPANENNVKIFQAHRLWGGTSDVLNGVAHFGYTALEVFVQLISFDDKEIEIYLVESAKKQKEIVNLSYKDLLKKTGIGEHSITSVGASPQHSFDFSAYASKIGIENIFTQPTVKNLFESANLGDVVDWSGVSTVKILQNKPKGVYKPFISVVNVTISHQPKNQDILFSETIFNGIAKPANGAVGLAFRTPNFFEWLNHSNPITGVQGRCFIRAQWTSETVPFADPEPFKLKLFHSSNIAPTHTLSVNAVENDYSEVVADVVIGDYRFEARVDTLDMTLEGNVKIIVLGWVQTSQDVPESYGYEPTLQGTPEINVMELIRGLAVERGKYITVDKNKLVFKDLPNIDTMNIVDVSHFFKRFIKGEILSKTPLKAVNNYIQYRENEQGDYARGNVKIEERTMRPLDHESVISTIPFAINRVYDENHKVEIPSTNEPLKLLENIEKFRIFRDTFNNATLYQIEFDGMNEVPEDIMYISQLNGLFLAEKIIKTSDKNLVVNCYKIKKQ